MIQSRDAAVVCVVTAVVASAILSVVAGFVVGYRCMHAESADGYWCTAKFIGALFSPPAVAIAGVAFGTRRENRRTVVVVGVATIIVVTIALAVYAQPRAV